MMTILKMTAASTHGSRTIYVMNRFIISGILAALVVGAFALLFSSQMRYPYEEPDDPAWQCTLNSKTAHLLAEDTEAGADRRVLVEWEDGTRSWEPRKSLPHYLKIHGVDTGMKTLMMSDKIEELLLGKTLDEIERKYVCAFEHDNRKAVFPIKVLTANEATSTEWVTVSFKDGVADEISYEKVEDRKALVFSYIPLAYPCVRLGLKARQADGFVTNDGKVIGGLQSLLNFLLTLPKLLLALLVLIIMVVAPVVVSLPFVFIFKTFIPSKFYGNLLSIIITLAISYAYLLMFFLTGEESLFFPIAAIVACIIMFVLVLPADLGY